MTLSEQSIQILRSRGDDCPLQNGFRYVKNTSYLSQASIDSQATVAIPNELESVETLQFLELCPEAAQFVFNNFLLQKAQFPDRADILSSAIDHVESIQGDAFSEADDDWIDVMNRIGMTSKYQIRVMDPDFSDMRLNGSAKHWIMEMMKMRFEFLDNFDKVIKNHGKGPNRKVGYMDLSDKFKSGPPHLIPEYGSSKGPAIGTFSTSGPSTATATDSQPEKIDGHQMFYRGGSLVRLNMIHSENNRLNIRKIRSAPPGDFSEDIPALYLTKQAPVAWQYAQWVKKFVDGAVVPVGILAIAIPDNLLTSITQVASDYEWRKLVWNSRRLQREDVTLAHLMESQWLTGPLCRQITKKILRMNSPAELEIWKLENGETACQHFTYSIDMLTMLQKACVDKVWITEMAWEEAKK